MKFYFLEILNENIDILGDSTESEPEVPVQKNKFATVGPYLFAYVVTSISP